MGEMSRVTQKSGKHTSIQADKAGKREVGGSGMACDADATATSRQCVVGKAVLRDTASWLSGKRTS